VVATGDSLFPGLIELHNHLAYDAMPLWDVPTRYSNNGQWRGLDPYKRLTRCDAHWELTGPAGRSHQIGLSTQSSRSVVR